MKLLKHKIYNDPWFQAHGSTTNIIEEQVHNNDITLIHFEIRVQVLRSVGTQVRNNMKRKCDGIR